MEAPDDWPDDFEIPNYRRDRPRRDGDHLQSTGYVSWEFRGPQNPSGKTGQRPGNVVPIRARRRGRLSAPAPQYLHRIREWQLARATVPGDGRSEEHTSELQS